MRTNLTHQGDHNETLITPTRQQNGFGSDTLSVFQFQWYQTKRNELRDENGRKQMNIHSNWSCLPWLRNLPARMQRFPAWWSPMNVLRSQNKYRGFVEDINVKNLVSQNKAYCGRKVREKVVIRVSEISPISKINWWFLKMKKSGVQWWLRGGQRRPDGGVMVTESWSCGLC